MLLRDARALAVPIVAHSRQRGHQCVPEQLERTQDRRESSHLPVDGRRVVALERSGERGRIDLPSLESGPATAPHSRPPAGQVVQFLVA